MFERNSSIYSNISNRFVVAAVSYIYIYSYYTYAHMISFKNCIHFICPNRSDASKNSDTLTLWPMTKV